MRGKGKLEDLTARGSVTKHQSVWGNFVSTILEDSAACKDKTASSSLIMGVEAVTNAHAGILREATTRPHTYIQ